MRFDVISLFPEMFEAMRYGVTGRAIERGQATWRCGTRGTMPKTCIARSTTGPMVVVRAW